MRYEKGDTIRILYEARALTTGLTDVLITIWGPSKTKLVDGSAMTELANGMYYYDYTIPDIGNYIYQCSCVTQPKYLTDWFYVTLNPWDAKTNDHKSSGTMGHFQKHGGGLYQSQTTGMNDKYMESLIKRLDNILDKQKEFEKSVEDMRKRIGDFEIMLDIANTNMDLKVKGLSDNFVEKFSKSEFKDDEINQTVINLVDEIINLKSKNDAIETIIKEVEKEKSVKELHTKVDNFKTNMVDIEGSVKNINSDVNAKMEELKVNMDKFEKALIKISTTDQLNQMKIDDDVPIDKELILKELDIRKILEEKEIEKLKNDIAFLKGKDYGMEIQKLKKEIVGLPFAEYPDFAACVADQKKKGHDDKSARAICATIHKKVTGKWPSEMSVDYNPSEFDDTKLLDDWRIVNFWYNTKGDNPSLLLLGKMLYDEINSRITSKKLEYDFNSLKDRTMIDRLSDGVTSTSTSGVGGFGGKVFYKKAKKKKKCSNLSEFEGNKLVLEKFYGGEDVEIEDGNNILLAEEYNDNYYVYDIIRFEGEDISDKPWYDRIKTIKKVKLRDNEKETQTLVISSDEKIETGLKIMGNCRIRRYDGSPDDVMIYEG